MDNRREPHSGKVKSLPPETLIKKVFSKVKDKGSRTISRISATAFGTEITDVEFVKGFRILEGELQNLAEVKKYFCERKQPRFLVDISKRRSIVSLIYQHFPSIPDKITAEADKICEHIFDLLGSGPVEVCYGMKAKGFEGHSYDTQICRGELTPIHNSQFTIHNYQPIDWHIDFKSGYRWNPNRYYKAIRYGHTVVGADIKIPWELSRFQHLTILGEAYFFSKNEKYVKESVNQITDWIENNPPKFGVNWACTMDVAIRACNWLLAWGLFRDSPLISNEFIIKFVKSLFQHGRHIKNNLEYSETLTSNHYLSDVVGLVYLGVLVPEFKESKKWKNFGIEELKKEMKKQVYPDGVDFEASTCYHRLVLELFFYAAFLVIVNDKNFKEDNFIEVGNEIFGEEYIQRLYKMFEFVLHALKPNGGMPQIGDNDNGRLHIFTNREVLDMRYLLILGAIFFKEPRFKIKELGFCEEALWVFGEKGHKIWQGLKESCLKDINSRAFPDAGWYVMRSDKDYMFVSCGPNGQNGNGGHCHNDKLSFELCVDGKDFIVDPGTYVYTGHSDWRNKFRSTARHNTLVIDGKEQNRFDGKNLFWLRDEAKVKVNKWEKDDEYDFLDVQHSGYERLSAPVTHRRQVVFDRKGGYWIVRDILSGKGKHNFDLYFHFAPMKLEVEKENPLVVYSNIAGGPNIVIVPMETEGLKVSIQEEGVSFGYGEKVTAPVIRYSKTTRTPVQFVSVIYPFEASVPSIENIKETATAFFKNKEIVLPGK